MGEDKNKTIAELIAEQYDYYSGQMKSRKDKSLLKKFCIAVLLVAGKTK